jgi:hypothetical protein
MSLQNNSIAIIAGMLSTLVGGGLYLQWLDFNRNSLSEFNRHASQGEKNEK